MVPALHIVLLAHTGNRGLTKQLDQPAGVRSDPSRNAQDLVEMAKSAHKEGALVIAFPELSVTGYALDDLFRNQLMIRSALKAVLQVAEGTKDLDSLIIVGAPLELGCQLFNTAVVMAKGAILGVIPKTYLPNYSEFY